ncbi:MAG TPA: HEAT repeat domain-containing protein [Turneriella sp.]|nr:HEAT repeat domain-containing protein [Turneriella sp.]
MKFCLCLVFIFSIFTAALFSLDIELESAINAKDSDKVLAIFRTKKLSEDDLTVLFDFAAQQKEKMRKEYLYAIRDKNTTDATIGKHIYNEIMRLIKENRVEDNLPYTLLCLQLAETNKNSDLLYAVAPFLVHPREKLRIEANKIIAIKKDERIYPLIGQLLAGENDIDKIYAMETLTALKDERAVPLLLQQLTHTNKNIRYYALKSLEAIASDKAQYGIIRVAESDASEEVRLKGVEVLRYFKTGPVTSALQKLIGDKNLAVRNLALESALFQKLKAYASTISEQLAQESEPEQKEKLLQGLFVIGSGGGMNGVYKLLKQETDAHLLIGAAYACNRFNETKCNDLLIARIATEKDESTLVEFLYSLGEFKYKKNLPLFIDILKNAEKSTLVRSAALNAIRAYDGEATVLPLFDIYSLEKDLGLRAQMKETLTDLMRRKLAKL